MSRSTHNSPNFSVKCLLISRDLSLFFPPVYDKSSELGGAVVGGRLPSPDARQHEVAFHKVQHRRPILYQHSRRGKLIKA